MKAMAQASASAPAVTGRLRAGRRGACARGSLSESRHASAIQVTTFGCLAGTVACLPFAWQFASQIGQAPPAVTLNVVYLGLFPTTLGFVTWAYALARTTSGKMGATTYAVPGLVVVMSWLILGQVPRWLTIAGGILCLAGVAVSRSRATAEKTVRQKAQPEVPTAASEIRRS